MISFTHYMKKWMVICLYLYANIKKTFGQTCPGGHLATFAKVSAVVPKSVIQPEILYVSSRGVAITAECYNRCRSTEDCVGFILDYERSSCFKVSKLAGPIDDFVPAPNSNFFIKVCLQVPMNCTQRAWPIEYVPNMELVGYEQHVIPNVQDKWQCAQLCLTGSTQYRYGDILPCYSAQYHAWSKSCALSTHSRRSQPEAFVAALSPPVDYMENQCLAETVVGGNTACWHEPVYNETLPQIELQIPNISFEQCRERCEKEQYFNCRGFTHRGHCAYGARGDTCLLHSEDTFTATHLVPSPCSTYVERLACIDLKVDCTSSSMQVTLHDSSFAGRIFALGHSEDCGVSGRPGVVVTILTLPIPTPNNAYNRCGMLVVNSVGYGNRMATAVLVVQRHSIIQTIGDRVVKISCIASDDPTAGRFPRPLYNNITLDATFGVAEPAVQESISNVAEGFDNASSVSPSARLRILDVSKGGVEAREAMLGEELEFRIDVFPPFNVSMMRAGHLVASTGDGRDSLLLLDWRGCPPDTSTFPALVAKSSHTLSATFKAFRFPSSPVLRFSIILTICDGPCQPTDCGNGINSWGRRRRRSTSSVMANLTEQSQEVPLQLTILVRSPNSENVTLASAPFPILPNRDDLTVEAHESVLCVTYPVLVASALCICILQIALLTVCCVIAFRSKKKVIPDQSTRVNQNEINQRRVTWADANTNPASKHH